MKIKSFLIVFSITALCLSCTKENEAGKTIRFKSISVGQQQKNLTLDTSVKFGTYSWKTTGTWSSTSASEKLSSPYMVNVETSYDGENWTPGSYRWPTANSYLHFACYGPYKAASPMTYDLTKGICIKDYTLDYDNQEDFVYSGLTTDCYSATHSTIGINFNHALCQVAVKLQRDDVPSGLTSVVKSCSVTLKKLSVDALYNIATFEQNSSPKWTSQSGSASYTIFSGSKTLSTDPDESCGTFYVIPQTFTSGVQAIKLEYDASITYSDDTVKSGSFSDTHYFYDLSLNDWAPGMKAVYTITVSAFADELSFGAYTADWNSITLVTTLGGNL